MSIRDGNIRYYEYDSDTLYALSEHKSTEPQRGMCFLPRRAVEVSECEIGRAYKVTGTAVEAIAFIVPRKVNFNFIVVHVPLISFTRRSPSKPIYTLRCSPRNQL